MNPIIRIMWLPALFIASLIGASIDQILDFLASRLTLPNIATLVIFAIACLFFYSAVKANQKHEQ